MTADCTGSGCWTGSRHLIGLKDVQTLAEGPTQWEAALRHRRQAGAFGGGAGLQRRDIEVPVADTLHILCLAVLHLGLGLPSGNGDDCQVRTDDQVL
jgi:hypothetical protein